MLSVFISIQRRQLNTRRKTAEAKQYKLQQRKQYFQLVKKEKYFLSQSQHTDFSFLACFTLSVAK